MAHSPCPHPQQGRKLLPVVRLSSHPSFSPSTTSKSVWNYTTSGNVSLMERSMHGKLRPFFLGRTRSMTIPRNMTGRQFHNIQLSLRRSPAPATRHQQFHFPTNFRFTLQESESESPPAPRSCPSRNCMLEAHDEMRTEQSKSLMVVRICSESRKKGSACTQGPVTESERKVSAHKALSLIPKGKCLHTRPCH